jgi:3-dehydrosphinganine reductase
MMDINYFGSVNVTKSVLPDMKSSHSGGIIVFVSSLAGLVGLYGFTGYSASKFAVRGFAEALAMGTKYHLFALFFFCKLSK